MNVRDLIIELNKCNPDADVILPDEHCDRYYETVTGTIQNDAATKVCLSSLDISDYLFLKEFEKLERALNRKYPLEIK